MLRPSAGLAQRSNPGPRDATPVLFRRFAPRSDDPRLIGGRWWEGANGGGIKATSEPFSKLLQKSRVLLQAFPKKSLAVLWDFKGLQGFQTSFDAFQIFPPSAAPFRPHFGRRRTAFRRLAWSASGGPPDFTMQFGRRRVHRGAATQIERIFNLTDSSISGKKYP